MRLLSPFQASTRLARVVGTGCVAGLIVLGSLGLTGCVFGHHHKDATSTTTPTTPTPPGPEKVVGDAIDTGPPRFKSCHGMETHAVLYRQLNPPRVIGKTHIWSHCWIGGFTGTVVVTIGDADGDPLTSGMPDESWGVNGKAEAGGGGTSNDREVVWQANIADPSLIPEARTISVENTWAPRNRLLDIVTQAIAAGKKLLDIKAAITALTG
jgi:hypothetical protein